MLEILQALERAKKALYEANYKNAITKLDLVVQLSFIDRLLHECQEQQKLQKEIENAKNNRVNVD